MKNPNCELCKGTGYYGDNGPGVRGNREYMNCEVCNPHSLTPEPPNILADAYKSVIDAALTQLDAFIGHKNGHGGLHTEIEFLISEIARLKVELEIMEREMAMKIP